MARTVVEYVGDLRCRSEHSESGVIVTTDAPKDNQGLGESFSPSDLLAVSLGSCILSMMGIAARSLGVDISGATATVEKEMGNAPRRITDVCVTVHVPHQPTEEQARRLEIAGHSCPVHASLDPALNASIQFIWGEPRQVSPAGGRLEHP